MSSPDTAPRSEESAATDDRWTTVQRGSDFVRLRSRLRRFVFPAAALFFTWYFAYVLLAAYAPEFMAITLGSSNITVGLLIGLSQFVTTFAITTAYVRFARVRLDPLAEQTRAEVEGAEVTGTTEGDRR